jgi:hypothetical protein
VARELLRAGRRLGLSPDAWSRSLGARCRGGCSGASAGASGSRGRVSWRRHQARRGRGAGVAVSGERRPRRGGGPGRDGKQGRAARRGGRLAAVGGRRAGGWVEAGWLGPAADREKEKNLNLAL